MRKLLIYSKWRNFDAPIIYDVTDNILLSSIFLAMYFIGVIFLISSTFALDHFHLFGLSQGFGFDFNQAIGFGTAKTVNTPSSGIVTRWHYKIVAHPIMTGVLVMMWATPLLTMPRLLYSTSFTVYIMIAVLHFEEPDLVVELGGEYANYLRTVPRFIPFTKSGSKLA